MSLNKKIISLIKRKKMKLAIVESCTGGMLSSAITSVSGSSKVFTMGLVTYSNISKNRLLRVPMKVIKRHGAVSIQGCLSMVKNLSRISRSNISVSITGIAGPGGGSKKKPVGLVYIGLIKGPKIRANKFIIKNNGRSFIQKTIVKKSLKLIKEIV